MKTEQVGEKNVEDEELSGGTQEEYDVLREREGKPTCDLIYKEGRTQSKFGGEPFPNKMFPTSFPSKWPIGSPESEMTGDRNEEESNEPLENHQEEISVHS